MRDDKGTAPKDPILAKISAQKVWDDEATQWSRDLFLDNWPPDYAFLEAPSSTVVNLSIAIL